MLKYPPLLLVLPLTLACAGPQRAGMPSPGEGPQHQTEGANRAPGSVRMFSGEVLGVDRVGVGDQNKLTLRLRIANEDEPVVVELGPGWFWDEQGLRFEPNEPIRLQATEQVVAGQPVLRATVVTKGGQTIRVPVADGSESRAEPGEERAGGVDAGAGR